MRPDSQELYPHCGSLIYQGRIQLCPECFALDAEILGHRETLEPKVASAFGGGIGRRGSLCGALTGGVIAIGVKYGSNNPVVEEREKAYSLALEFYNRFKKDLGSVLCRDLIGYDLTNPEELEKARNSNVSMSKCIHIVEKAVEILIGLK